MDEFGLHPESQRSYLKPLLLALAVLAVIAAVFFYLNPRKGADLTIARTQIYAAHTTFTTEPGPTHVLGVAPHTEDDLYIVVTARLKDKLRFPFRINDITATYTAADGSSIDTYVPGVTDLSRLEQIFPALTPMMINPLNDSTEIAPGATVEGTVVLHFPGLTEDAWKARKSATLTINLVQQPPVTTTIP